MENEKIEKAIQNADSNVSIENMTNERRDLELVSEALRNSKTNGSFLSEVVRLVNEESEKDKEKEKYGKR